MNTRTSTQGGLRISTEPTLVIVMDGWIGNGADGGYGRLVALDLNFVFTLVCAGDVAGHLHPHESVHLRAECLLYAKRHGSGQVGAAVEKRR